MSFFEKNEKIFHYTILCVSVATFFWFGLFHLAEFETTDEHLWKYHRIPQYWHAIAQHNWQETYINDKPGITVALFSGIGLLFEQHPENQYATDHVPNSLFEKYDPQKTLRTNFIFRLPVLIIATLSLLGFYLLIRAAYDKQTSLIFTSLLATNPILIGMSQIVNPDSFFWFSGGLAICAYIALIHTDQRKYLILCGILTGFAFLSKYTAFTLFLFFALYDLGYQLFTTRSQTSHHHARYAFSATKRISVILLIACGIFSFFLPAVFSTPMLMFKGIAQFLTLKKIFFLFLCAVIIGTSFVLGKTYIHLLTEALIARRSVLIKVFVSFFLFIVGFNMLNVWTGQKIIPFDKLRDAVYANEPQSFNFKPFLTEDAKIVKKSKAFFLETYPIIFSLMPIILIAITGGALWTLKNRKDTSKNNMFMVFTFAMTSFLLVYFALTVMARVVVNVRYSIILYPILTLWASLILVHVSNFLRISTRLFYAYVIFILIVGCATLWNIRPFYFSYTNFFLPQKFSIHDSWGHGAYEAAQRLNTLPNADQLIIWSNSDTVCRFFNGSCLRSRKIDLANVTPDYFVISKRGAIKERNHFVLLNNPHPHKDASYYFSNLFNRAIWTLYINNRSDNYIVIVPYEN